jgi:hypothetical protein
MFIYHANHQPTHRTLLITNRIPRRLAIRRNHHLLMHTRAMRINRDLRCALIFAIRADGLADHESPTIEARMFPSRYDVSFDACKEHEIS